MIAAGTSIALIGAVGIYTRRAAARGTNNQAQPAEQGSSTTLPKMEDIKNAASKLAERLQLARVRAKLAGLLNLGT